jgi:hypothetical protein
LDDDPEWGPRAHAVAAKTYEVMAYLDEVRGWRPEGVGPARPRAYHDSCSGLRELGIKAQPRRLLGAVEGLSLEAAGGRRNMLRLRRHLLRQISRHLQRHCRGESRRDRGERRRSCCSRAISAA